jgi:hypothetical protein
LAVHQYITASCVISDHGIIKDETPVFENTTGSVTDFMLSAYNHLNDKYPKFYKMDNLSKLGWLAAEYLLRDHFKTGDYPPGEIGVILSNASSSLDTDLRYYDTVKSIPSPSLFVYTLPNIVIGEICIRNHFKGENAFFVFDQFDANFMEEYAGGLLNNNILQACIVGWVELLGETWKAMLVFIENKNLPGAKPFSAENLLKIYHAKFR